LNIYQPTGDTEAEEKTPKGAVLLPTGDEELRMLGLQQWSSGDSPKKRTWAATSTSIDMPHSAETQ
jgi:hypothetical protein